MILNWDNNIVINAFRKSTYERMNNRADLKQTNKSDESVPLSC